MKTTIKEIRSQRVAAEIPATLLARRARLDRSRLSLAERQHVQLTEAELQRLETALTELITAKRKVHDFAAEVGWPVEALV